MTWDDDDRIQPWWLLHANLVTLLTYLDEEPAYTKGDMLAAIEKPWKYTPEFERARQRQEELSWERR